MAIWLNEIRPSVAVAEAKSQFLRLFLQTRQNTNNHPHKSCGTLQGSRKVPGHSIFNILMLLNMIVLIF